MQGFHGRAGLGRHPALIVVDVNVGFTDPESPLVCDLEDVVVAIQRLLAEMRSAGLPVAFTTVSFDEDDKETAAAFIDKIPALLTLEAGSRWVEIDPRIAPREGEPVLNKLFASAFFGTRARELPDGERVRQPHRHGSVDFRLRPGDRRRRHPARLPTGRPARGRGRPQSRCACRQPLRHRHEVRGRRLRRRRARAARGDRCHTRSLRRSCSPTRTLNSCIRARSSWSAATS